MTEPPKRNSPQARTVANRAYRFKGCVVCGLQLKACLQVAHLDHDPSNNRRDNLAFFCPTHHGMYDCGLYSAAAILLLRAHWQLTRGKPDHKPRMKNAGAKAAATRRKNREARSPRLEDLFEIQRVE